MLDREKVIKGLECCKETGWTSCHTCPYYCGDVVVCTPKLKSDAIALLKAQEPIKPVFERQFMSNIELYDCGKCGTSLGAKGIAKYCMKCGQKVKWDEQAREGH